MDGTSTLFIRIMLHDKAEQWLPMLTDRNTSMVARRQHDI